MLNGNGFLGKYFVEIFKNYNFFKNFLKLLVIDNSFKKNELSKDKNIKFVKADISKNIKINFQPNIIIQMQLQVHFIIEKNQWKHLR